MKIPAIAAAVAAALSATPAMAEGWRIEDGPGGAAAGSTVGDEFAGLRFECTAGGPLRTVLSHNGSVFDREREYTVVLSVDGVATAILARAVASERPGDDDFVRSDRLEDVVPLLEALAAGSLLEISAPSGRYRLSLQGSARALAALRQACTP